MAAETQPVTNLEQLAKAGNWDELSKQAIAKTLSWVEAGEKFVSEQAPLVVNEAIRWGMAKCVMAMILFAVICGAGWFLLRWGQRMVRDSKLSSQDKEFGVGIMWFFRFVFLAIGTIGISYWAYRLCYIWCAPRLYLIETLREMCK